VRPYAAHDARAVAIRARNARSWLEQLGWCLGGHPDVLNYWLEVNPAMALEWRQGQRAMIVLLDSLLASLAATSADVAEGRGDGQ
jgi:hypothetical protein